MLTFFAVLASLHYIRFAFATRRADEFLFINPVGVVQCEEYTIQWRGGFAPFAVTINDPTELLGGTTYASWTGVSTNSLVWVVDILPKGSIPLPIQVMVVDATGNIGYSAKETIQPGTIALDSFGLCTSIGSPANTDPSTSSASTSAPTSGIDSGNTATFAVGSTANATSAADSSPTATSTVSSGITTVDTGPSGMLIGVIVVGGYCSHP
ncbi:hypothetical protein MVEN_02007600 [Mycena venus]|uniref:Uncharacterized protein n=1 Tax=Mycena venus TaxID=2733690 RepID=A0A8H6XB85_9AGAR|nr:hypothetical protein MVEN_02007600 [Mycena venus]